MSRALAARLLIDFGIVAFGKQKGKPPVFVLKTSGFGPSGETRLHLRRKAQIEDRLGQTLAGGAYPCRI